MFWRKKKKEDRPRLTPTKILELHLAIDSDSKNGIKRVMIPFVPVGLSPVATAHPITLEEFTNNERAMLCLPCGAFLSPVCEWERPRCGVCGTTSTLTYGQMLASREAKQ